MSTQDIKLTFINNSNDANNSSIVIFQSANSLSDTTAQPSHVLENFAPGESRTVQLTGYSVQAYVTGNPNPSNMESVNAGQALKAVGIGDGVTLFQHGNAENSSTIQVLNTLIDTDISVNLYNNGTHMYLETIGANATATFPATQSIHVGEASQNSLTEIALENIISANIIMTGGGSGEYIFTMDNVVKV